MRDRICFVEVQFQRDKQLYRRLFAEIFLFLQQNPDVQHWRAVVLYPSRREESEEEIPYQMLLESRWVQRLHSVR